MENYLETLDIFVRKTEIKWNGKWGKLWLWAIFSGYMAQKTNNRRNNEVKNETIYIPENYEEPTCIYLQLAATISISAISQPPYMYSLHSVMCSELLPKSLPLWKSSVYQRLLWWLREEGATRHVAEASGCCLYLLWEGPCSQKRRDSCVFLLFKLREAAFLGTCKGCLDSVESCAV